MSKKGGHGVFTKNIEFSLTVSDINRAIRELNNFQQQLHRAMQGLCEEMLENGALHAKIEISRLHAVDTGALMASIGHGAFDPSSRTGIVYAGGYYAFFVEFGTGIVGKDNPHPGLSDGTVGKFAVLGANGSVYTGYDTNHHGTEGWWYRPVGSNKYEWTKGMKARPFMYNTYLYLEDFAKRYGGEIIAEFIV